MVTKEELIAFEEDIANCFNTKQIHAPIHLYHGNEDHMMRVFENVKPNDWVCCTWRNHYQCLLKGVPKEELKRDILNGKSMVMTNLPYRIICSSIVGGIPSIATGIAWAEKLKGEGNRVWCFVGDMSAATGAWSEAHRYSLANDLPITFVIEDNEKSVETPTNKMWGKWHPSIEFSKGGIPDNDDNPIVSFYPSDKVVYYRYENKKFPHAGAGMRVQF